MRIYIVSGISRMYKAISMVFFTGPLLCAVLSLMVSTPAAAYWSIHDAYAAAIATTGNPNKITDQCFYRNGGCPPPTRKYLYSYHVKIDGNKFLYNTQGNPAWPYYCRDKNPQLGTDFWYPWSTFSNEDPDHCVISSEEHRWYYDDEPGLEDSPDPSSCDGISSGGGGNPTTSNPVKLSRGEKYYHFSDYVGGGGFPLTWGLIYREDVYQKEGQNVAEGIWYWPILSMRAIPHGTTQMLILLDSGTGALNFTKSGGSWTSDDVGFGVSDTLVDTVNGWTLRRSDGSTYKFTIYQTISGSYPPSGNQLGYVTQITNATGSIINVSYTTSIADTPSNALITSPESGNSLSVALSPIGLPVSLTDHENHVTHYIWDESRRLNAVVYPDDDDDPDNNPARIFEYDSTRQPQGATPPIGSSSLITGIFEATRADYAASIAASPTPLPENKRYSKVTYDNLGRVTESALWNGSAITESDTFSYKVSDTSNTDWDWTNNTTSTPTTIMTNMSGISTKYKFATIGGNNATSRNWQLTSVNGSADGVTGCAATSASTTYDNNGFLETTTDNNADNTAIVRKTQRLRDSRGRITTLSTGLDNNLNTTTDSQKVTTGYWDNTTNLPASKTYYGYKTGENDYRQEVFTYYSGNNRIATRTVKDLSGQGYLDRVWTYHYSPTDSSVNIEQMRVTDPRSYTTTYNYSNGHLTSISKPSINGVTQIIQYDNFNSFGLPRTVTEVPNNVVTQLEYDARRRLIDSTTAGAHTHIDYWPNGLVKKVTSPDLSWLQYDYNSAHQLTRISNQAGEHIEYSPSVLNGKWEKAVTYKAAGTAGTDITAQQRRVFDALGRLWKTQEIDPAAIQDANATAFDKTVFNYDANDNLQTAIALGDGSNGTPATYDSVNRVTFREFDGQNRIKCTMDTSPVAPYTCMGSVESTKYTYDDQGNVATVTDANGHITQYIYNGFGELVREESPDRGVTTYEYDLAGNLSKKTKAPDDVDEDGAGPDKDDTLEITYGWDALNRLTSIDYPGTAQDITYVYDAAADEDADCGVAVGHLCRVVQAGSVIDYTYNAFGNVTQKEETLTGLPSAQITLYGYNSANELESITYPSGQVVQVTRENSVGGETLGRISALSNGGVDFISSVGHRPFGGIKGWNTNSNDLINQYIRNYDANGHLAQYGVGATSQNETAMFTLQYDAYGSISALLDPDNLVKEAYGYDAQNRLTSVSAEYGDISYGYDAVGNRTGKVFNRFDPASNAIQEFYTEAYGIDPNSNRINSITRKVGGSTVRTRSFDYDARGNIKTDTRQKTGEAAESYPLIYGDSDRLNSITTP